MRLTAIYREGRNGNLKSMVQTDYKSKNKFKEDLRGNGFRVIAVLTDDEIHAIKTNRILDLCSADGIVKWGRFSTLVTYWEYVRECL